MKECCCCHNVFNESEFGVSYFYFHKGKQKRVPVYRSRCEKCRFEYSRNYGLKNYYSEKFKNKLDGKKKCSGCGRLLDVSKFRYCKYYFDKSKQEMKKSRTSICDKCRTEYNKKYWQENKERLTSKEKLAEDRKRRKEKFFQYRALRFRKAYGCEEIKTMVIAKMLWHKWHHQKGLCAITGRKLTKENAQVDHIEPRLNGHANNNPENLRWVIDDANRAKNQFTEEEFEKFIIDIYNNKKLELKNK